MSRFVKKAKMRKATSVFLSISTAVWLAGASALVPAVAHGQTVAELQTQIASLLAQIQALQVQLTTVQGGGSSTSMAGVPAGFTFTRNLMMGSTGDDVMILQKLLNSMADTRLASSGAGSSGNETSYFGSVTKAGVIKFQNKYASEVLTPLGLSAGTGFFGASSRTKANMLLAAAPVASTPSTPSTPATPSTPSTPSETTTPTTPTTPAAVGSGLTVGLAAEQPAASIFPNSAVRVPFTKVQLAASADGDVTVSSLVVERTGLATDAAFDSIALLDENGTQLGIQKTLNSQHQATLTEPFVVKAGTSRTMTIAGNAVADNSTRAGQVASLSVVGVNTTANVSGSLPLTGATHTVNSGLSIGSVTMARGSIDPGSSITKEVGTTGYTFAAVKITAGSTEDVYFSSIRWNQIGSAAGSDLKNVKTVVDGTEYNVTLSSDGKYYTAKFPGQGILIKKGFSKDVSVKGDIDGGSSRTVIFDIAKRNDIGLTGALYAFGIRPPATGPNTSPGDSAFSSGEDPWYNASTVTVSAGTITVSTSNSSPSQNIAINLANQPLGAFTVNVKGEPISVGRIGFNITLGSEGTGEDVDDVTNVSLIDENGAVVAGPVDGTAADSSNTAGSGDGSIIFTDTVTFPIGVHTYVLKGKIGTDITNNVTVTASTTPRNDFATVTGATTGNTITVNPNSVITFSQMTVKTGAFTVSVSSIPIAQTVIANSSQFELARYILDVTASGEDVRVTSLPLAYGATSGSATDLVNCKLYDGTAAITTGSNVVNPSAVSSSTTFTFDGTGLTIPRGTSKTLALKCDIIGGSTGRYAWGLDDSQQGSSYTAATGLVSGQTVSEVFNDSTGQYMSASSGGTLSVTLDTNSPPYVIVSPGQTVELARIKYSATNEDVDLKQVALQLSSVASNTPENLVGRQVTLHTSDGTQIASAVFPTGDNATSSAIASGAFRIPRDSSKVLVVKGTIAGITASGPMIRSGDLLTVNYDGDNEGGNTSTDGNYGVGVSSGNNVNPAVSDTAASGVRILKTYPEFGRIALSTSETLLLAGADRTLYKFSVKATNGDVAIYKFTLSVGSSTVSATTTAYGLYAYTDTGFASADTTFSSTGLMNASNRIGGTGSNQSCLIGSSACLVEIYPDKSSATTTYIIPSGATRYFWLRATVSSVETGSGSESISVNLQGDAAYPVNSANLMETAATTDGDAQDDFIWSPVSTTTQNTINDLDFTNGYQVKGLPDTNMTAEILTSTN